MKPLALMLAGLSVAMAQNTAGLRARELFYTPVAEVPPQSTQPKASDNKASDKKSAPKGTPATTSSAARATLGLRYSVLKRDDTGKFQEVDLDSTFRSGDAIRVRLEANTTAYLYVVTQGPSGRKEVLFPSKEAAGVSSSIHKGEIRLIPPDESQPWAFYEPAGAEKLFVILSRQPLPELEQGAVSDDSIQRLRKLEASRDLTFEKVDSDPRGGKGEHAGYVVNPSAAPDSQVVADVSLKHR